jgi:hypothetical protein
MQRAVFGTHRSGHDALGIDARAYRGVAAAFTELARVI